jgi:hypothetical protein
LERFRTAGSEILAPGIDAGCKYKHRDADSAALAYALELEAGTRQRNPKRAPAVNSESSWWRCSMSIAAAGMVFGFVCVDHPRFAADEGRLG